MTKTPEYIASPKSRDRKIAEWFIHQFVGKCFKEKGPEWSADAFIEVHRGHIGLLKRTLQIHLSICLMWTIVQESRAVPPPYVYGCDHVTLL